MRPLRLFLLLSTLTAAGVTATRPDVVLPAADRALKPLLAQLLGGPARVSIEIVAPKALAEPARPATPLAAAPADEAPAPQPSPALPSFVPQQKELTFSGFELDAPAVQDGATMQGQAQQDPTSPSVTDGQNSTGGSDTERAAAKPTVGLPITPDSAAPPAAKSTEPGTKPPPIVALVEPTSPTEPADSQEAPAVGETGAAKIIPAKELFGAAKNASPLAARAIGTYARGCLSGAVALPPDGPAWQNMRPSRNRNWGHPELVKLVRRLATDAQKYDDWPGLLMGDISQPRGGPMVSGHASHQVGLDADIWLTPMPSRTLSTKEREEISATSMLDKTDVAVDPKIFTDRHVNLIKRAASYPQVERVFVHPAIKKALCEASGADRKWLGKVRPIGGHYYHFHIRISCPHGFAGCRPQVPPTGEDGCGKEVNDWLARLAPAKGPPSPKPPGYKPKPPKPPMNITQLPAECRLVIEAGSDGIKVPPEAIPPPPTTASITKPASAARK